MPRGPRKKSENCRYHIMSRSISERDLFQNDEDKAYYLMLLKRYKEKNHCSIYAYNIMDNHVHLYINTRGYDISKFMLRINTAYVVYYNKKYQRHGHLFQGRFASTIVDNEPYSLTLSAYIHNNAKDLFAQAGKEDEYRYSSYGIYVGQRNDNEKILDTEEILQIFSKDIQIAQQKYKRFTESIKETGIMKEVDDNIMGAFAENKYESGKQYIVRDTTPEEIIRKITEILGENFQEGLRKKHNRESSKLRAFITYVLSTLCGYTYKKLCEYFGNMSISGIARLSNEGFKLLEEHTHYQVAFNELIYST